MQCPLLVLECRQITRRKATESSTTSRESELQPHRVVRARSVCTKGGYHGIYTPTGPLSE